MFRSGDAAPTPGCPATGLVKGSGFYPVIAGQAPHAAEGDLVASARVQGIEGGCKFGKDGITLDLTINFTGHQGPKGSKLDSQKFPYFLAVLSPDGQILQRQVFSTTVSFDNGAGGGTSSEEHRIRVPLKDLSLSPSYQIAAGFTLTPRQAQYNKENHAD
jgi:hypothetical protein